MDLTRRYLHLLSLVTTRKSELSNLTEFIEFETEYLIAPASIRYHMNKDEGLLEHSVNVAETLLKLRKILAPEISEESCVIVGLFHDLGKAGTPKHPQYIKRDPNDRNVMASVKTKQEFIFNPDQIYLSVPVRSIYLMLPYFPLTEEETQAIVYHDGQYVDDNKSVATREEKLTLLLQYADNWSGFIIEKK